MIKIADFVKEACSTVGTGALVLTGPGDNSSAAFGAVWGPSTRVYYAILDGFNRETGIGVFNGSTQISRDTILTTLESGVYDESDPQPIFLHGEATVACALNAAALSDIGGSTSDAIDVRYDPATDLVSTAVDVQNALVDHSIQIAANEHILNGNFPATSVIYNSVDDDITDEVNMQDAMVDHAEAIKTNKDDIVVLDTDVSFRESAMTGLESGGALVQNGTTIISIAAGNGEIIDSYTDTENQNAVDVVWSEIPNFDVLANGGMPLVTGIGITEIGIGVDGLPYTFAGGMSATQRRENIRLGTLEYLNREISALTNNPMVSNQVGNTLQDLIYFIPLADRLKGLTLRPTAKVVPDLSLWRDLGKVFATGANFSNSKSNPNVLSVPAAGSEIISFVMTPLRYNNGTIIVDSQIIEVFNDTYEPDGAGVLSAIPSNNVTIHYIYESLGGEFFLSYGQHVYSSFDAAIANLFGDFSQHLAPAGLNNTIALGQVVVARLAATWATDIAEVFPIGATISSGSSGGSALQAVNVSYTNNYGSAANVQTGLDEVQSVKMTSNQIGAMDAANGPTVANPVATMQDISDIPDINITGKADKIIPAVTSDLAALDATGNLADSGITPSTIAIKPSSSTTDNIATLAFDGSYKDSGTSIGDIVGGGGVSVIDDLNSTSPTAALSANQGRVLDGSKLDVGNVIDNLLSYNATSALSANQGRALNTSKLDRDEVDNNLTSTSTTNALSAAQGKILKDAELTVINNLTSTTTTNPLSANMGKVLQDTKLDRSEVTDSLTSTSTTDALSANQGKVLNDGKLNRSEVTNTLTSTSTTNALSAAQGKVLQDSKLGITATAVNSDKLRDVSLWQNGANWNVVPYILSDGSMGVGSHISFRDQNTQQNHDWTIDVIGATTFRVLNSSDSTVLSISSSGIVSAPQGVTPASANDLVTKTYVDPENFFTTKGYSKILGGLVLQWGTVAAAANASTIVFQTNFPNICLACIPAPSQSYNNSSALVAHAYDITSTQFKIIVRNIQSGSVVESNVDINWFAIGY